QDFGNRTTHGRGDLPFASGKLLAKEQVAGVREFSGPLRKQTPDGCFHVWWARGGRRTPVLEVGGSCCGGARRSAHSTDRKRRCNSKVKFLRSVSKAGQGTGHR